MTAGLRPPPEPAPQRRCASPRQAAEVGRSLSTLQRELAAGQVSYERLREACHLAGRDPNLHARRRALGLYNAYGAPRLKTEEAALQFLCMHLSYLYLAPGMTVCLNICRNLRGERPADYPSSVVYSEPFIRREGMVHVFRAGGSPAKQCGKRVVINPRGTSAGPGRDVLSMDWPTGIDPDADLDCVGAEFVADNASALRNLIMGPLNNGQPVTLAGHSLGGAIATHMFGLLSGDEQARCELISYNAPGLSHLAAAKAASPAQVRLVRPPYDLVTRVGQAHPPGLIIETGISGLPFDQRLRCHGVALLAMQEINGKGFDITMRTPSPFDTLELLELGRRAWARNHRRQNLTQLPRDPPR